MLARGSSSRGATRGSANPRGTSFRGRGRGANNSSGSSNTNPFEAERLENAAKREQKSQDRGGSQNRGGRGSYRGSNLKQVRFASPPDGGGQADKAADGDSKSSVSKNPFSGSLFGSSQLNGTGSPSLVSIPNPFAGAPNPFSSSPSNLANSTTLQNPFASPTQNPSPSQVHVSSGGNVAPALSFSSVNPFQAPRSGQNIFSFGTPFASNPSVATNPFASQTQNTVSNVQSNPFAASNPLTKQTAPAWPQTIPSTAAHDTSRDMSKFGQEIEDVLRKNGIHPPSWPSISGTLTVDRFKNGKVDVDNLFHSYKAYRAKARACLIKNGFIDDPDKPKKLSEAIDFMGTCEEMCPEFEKVSRIMDRDVREAEMTGSRPGDDFKASTRHMVKALARSAAGQDAPLPADIRSPPALRRTVDYLIDTVLGKNDIAKVHGFLWDRTRAIRRDFVFQQNSMDPAGLLDHVYCLETITRFHVIALHQMSHQDVISEDFSEQQEVEQLGKTLLSLIHAYEDCKAQNVKCENEAEFRAYYVLFNVDNTAILETVQDWGKDFWGKSSDIGTAVSLAECLQNNWDPHGPLKPNAPTDIAPNMFNRFFTILEDRNVSYTMACFAEVHFNRVRKAAFKTILASYRKQRDQTRDWSLQRLNQYLRFDHEDEIVHFGEAYSLHFEVLDDELYLSFTSDDTMVDPLPKLKQAYSFRLVERKRGDAPLPAAIHQTIYEPDQAGNQDGDTGMFVPESTPWIDQKSVSFGQPDPMKLSFPSNEFPKTDSVNQFPMNPPSLKTTSIFNGIEKSPDNPSVATPINTPPSSNQPPIFGTGFTEFNNGESSGSIFAPKKIPSDSSGSAFTFGQPARKTSTLGSEIPKSTSPSTFSQFLNLSESTKSNFAPRLEKSEPDGSASSNVASQTTSKSLFDQLKPAVSSTPVFPVPPNHSNDTTSGQPKFQFGTPKEQPQSINNAQTNTSTSTAPSILFGSPKPDKPKSPEKSQSSFSVSGDIGAPRSQKPGSISTLFSSKPMSISPPKFQMNDFARWYVQADEGLLDQFAAIVVHQAVAFAADQFLEEEERKAMQAEEADIAKQIADFRTRSLVTKYGYLWRKNAHRRWMKRKGREARAARRQMAEEFRAAELARSQGLVEDFRSSQQMSARRSMEETSIEPQLLDGVDAPGEKSRNGYYATSMSTYPENGLSSIAQTSKSLSKIKTSPSGRRRKLSGTTHRRSMSSDISLGGSRIHLIPNYNPRYERQRQTNGVKTDYFRLKARGIMTLPDGTPLANTAAVHLFDKGKTSGRDNLSVTPNRSFTEHQSRSVLTKLARHDLDRSRTPSDRRGDIDALKTRAKDIVLGVEEKRQNKRLFDDDDEELFAKAKRIREQMDEGAKWYREEIEKDSGSRSVS